MDTIALTNFACQIDFEELIVKLHMANNSTYIAKIREMVTEAQLLGRPKAVYGSAYIESKGDNSVIIDGVKFTSRVLRVNMEETFQAFPFVVTCGTELEDWSQRFGDYFESYCADAIKEMVLRAARQEFDSYVDQRHALGHAVNMNPGSLADWPISEQNPLFQLLGNVRELIGVQLLDSCLMFPMKTVSGIRFPKAGTFESCQLCSREQCPGRKAPYDQGLYDRKYRLETR